MDIVKKLEKGKDILNKISELKTLRANLGLTKGSIVKSPNDNMTSCYSIFNIIGKENYFKLDKFLQEICTKEIEKLEKELENL